MKDHSEKEKAKEKALALLKNRDKTVFEISEALKKNSFGEDNITETINYLKDLGYLDDFTYAANFTEMSMDKRRGPLRITRELEAKGISRDLIDATLKKEMDDQWERNNARLLAHEIKKKNTTLASDKQLAKIVNKLTYEGYSEDVIKEITEDFLSDIR